MTDGQDGFAKFFGRVSVEKEKRIGSSLGRVEIVHRRDLEVNVTLRKLA